MSPLLPPRPAALLGPRTVTRGWSLLASVLVLAGLFPPGPALAAGPTLSPETQQVLVAAVEAAVALDLYNARCRSDDSGRHGDNLNKLLVSKLRLTIVSVQDEWFPERGFRGAQRRLQETFTERLSQAGGCKGAKEAGLPDQLKTRFREAVAAVEALP